MYYVMSLSSLSFELSMFYLHKISDIETVHKLWQPLFKAAVLVVVHL